MARVPKYCYRVLTTKRLGTQQTLESHNFETLPGAIAFREIALGKERTVRVEVVMVLDESTPSHRTEGIIERSNHETASRPQYRQRPSWRLADRPRN